MQSNQDQQIIVSLSSFEKTQKIGEGTSGAVFAGKTIEGSEVAIKLYHQDNVNEELQKEFENMIRTVKLINHPNLLQIIGYCPNPAGLIMELLPYSLFSALKNQEMTWKQRFEISLQIVEGLQGLHEAKLIHGNIKSTNILLDANLGVKLGDMEYLVVQKFSKKSAISDEVKA